MGNMNDVVNALSTTMSGLQLASATPIAPQYSQTPSAVPQAGSVNGGRGNKHLADVLVDTMAGSTLQTSDHVQAHVRT